MTAPIRNALHLGDERWLVEAGGFEAIDGLLSIGGGGSSTANRHGWYIDFVVVEGQLFLETIHITSGSGYATWQASAPAISREGSAFAVPSLRNADERHLELPTPVVEVEHAGFDGDGNPVQRTMTRYRDLRLPLTTTGTWVVGKRHDDDGVRRQALTLRDRRTLRFVDGRPHTNATMP